MQKLRAFLLHIGIHYTIYSLCCVLYCYCILTVAIVTGDMPPKEDFKLTLDFMIESLIACSVIGILTAIVHDWNINSSSS